VKKANIENSFVN